MAAMRPVFFGSVVLIAGIFAATARVPAHAQPAQSELQAGIVVIGQGSVRVAPDYADIGCGVTTKAKTAKEATEANSKVMGAITAALIDSGVARQDVQTSRFSLQPVYAPPQPNSEPKLNGFSVSNQFNVTIRQIDKVGAILDRLIAAGATDVGSVEFQHSDQSKLLDQAREAAIADAKRKAELYAGAAGLRLGNIVWIAKDAGRPIPFSPQAALRAAAPAVPIAIGQDTLQATVTVGFDLAR